MEDRPGVSSIPLEVASMDTADICKEDDNIASVNSTSSKATSSTSIDIASFTHPHNNVTMDGTHIATQLKGMKKSQPNDQGPPVPEETKKTSKIANYSDIRAGLDDWRKNKKKDSEEGGLKAKESDEKFHFKKRNKNLSESSGHSSHASKKFSTQKPSSASRVQVQPLGKGGFAEKRCGSGQFQKREDRWPPDQNRVEGHHDGAGGWRGNATNGRGHWDGARGCITGRGYARGHPGFGERHGTEQDRVSGWSREASNPSRGSFHQGDGDKGPRKPGFHRLNQWAAMDSDAVVNILANSRNGFVLLLHSELQPDIMRLVIALLAKACAADFKENKTAVLAAACDVRFQSALAVHLSSVHTDEDSRRRGTCADTFAQLLLFCETAFALLPVTAAERLGATLTFLRVAMDNVKSFHGLALPAEMGSRLQLVQEQIKEQQARRANLAKRETGLSELLRVLPPPDDYRQLPIFPTAKEVTTRQRPFLRPNIVDGAYQSAEHYLDVQFRLLREDFVQPLREGICAVVAGNDQRSGSVREYHGVTILRKLLTSDRIGLVVQFAPLPRVKWEQSKRLMFGSLLCFSRDGFASVLFATVMDRNVDELKQGRVGIELAKPTDENLFGQQYLMLESEVYFAPYHHVLQALQKMPSDKFPMSNYIVDVTPQTNPPIYLRDNPNFQYRIRDGDKDHAVFPLNDASWPAEMTLNESQREAFKAALTREFVVIQGPPGTGKTHLGLMIAKTLITNVTRLLQGYTPTLDPDTASSSQPDSASHSEPEEEEELAVAIADKDPVESRHSRIINERSSASHLPSRLEKDQSPILVVCYTNHALDQFLEGLLETTTNIIRVGGRSKSEQMKPLNLKERQFANRSMVDFRGEHIWLGKNIHAQMSELMASMRVLLNDFRDLDNHRGVLSVHCIGQVYKHENLEAFCDGDGSLDDGIFLHWTELGENMDGLPDIQEPANHQNDNQDYDEIDPEVKADIWDRDDERRELEDEFHLDRNVVVNVGVRYAVDQTRIQAELADLREFIDEGKERYKTQMIEAKCRHRELCRSSCFYSRWLRIPQPAELQNIEQLLAKDVCLWELNVAQRRACYEHWVRLVRIAMHRQLLNLEADFRYEARRYEETKQMENLKLLRNVDVVGMTTTMAAKLQPLLQALRPRIVIVEEAAEVTEAHIVVALTHHCQHLILIGDHQQLRPNTATFRLARDFHLDVSLFERMLRNGLHCSLLNVQHRMRPEIAQLIAPAIYPNLHNHESVACLEPMRGITRSMLFFTHANLEEQVGETSSKRNMFEGDIVLALCRYILQQGYTGDQVTILTTYSGQMFYMKEACKMLPSLSDVKITIVDNYQGEENDIILLSLVRNNVDRKIGFLSIENRVCVALSRAKCGLYIFGNIDSLVASSTIWPKIRDELVNQGALVERFPLQCQVHLDQFTDIANAADFCKVSEGGCQLKCNTVLRCGHPCMRLCHGDDRDHSQAKCFEPCTRVPSACPLQHGCPLLCHEPCGDCMRPVERKLPCGHEQTLACHIDISTCKCQRIVAAVDPPCGHVFEKPCHVMPHAQKCTHPCKVRIACGHSCVLKCHVDDDPDHMEYECKLDCPKTNAGCSENHACSRLCCEPCGDCLVQVVKTPNNCDHKTKVICSLPQEDIVCLWPCARVLPCTHLCPRQCFEECGGCQVKACKMLPSLSDVKITIVDNYQGEENDIILLSLVRNNVDRKIGFLSIENRVCVALSRAKCGLYIFGNIDSLVASSTIWPKIRDELVNQGALVERFPLQCQVHLDQFTDIANAADFCKVPEGGCQLKCNTVLRCGHPCMRLCHGDDRDHSQAKCFEPCTRVPSACPLQHGCPLLCHEPCGDCMRPVERKLPCGHEQTLACHIDISTFKCQRIVAAVDPPCGHVFEKPCHVMPHAQKCTHPCKVRIACGHSCVLKCHVDDDPDHIEYECKLDCPKTNAGCSENHACSRLCCEPCGDCLVQVVKTPNNCDHKTKVICSLPQEDIVCLWPCARVLPCTHLCPRQCFEECGGCQVKVTKSLEVCHHEAEITCCVNPEHSLCRKGCQREISCGHRCPKLCRLPCIPVSECKRTVPQAATLVCGHTISLPCNIKAQELPADSELLLQRCKAECGAVLGCGHVCPGSCGECLQGRAHISCKEKCNRVLVCGHVCKSACADTCPPCIQPCLMRCPHSSCNLKCGVPCRSCKMKCNRRCPHGSCNKRCGEDCNCEPCIEPCSKRLSCKHPCMGFCGEPCPPLCRKCRPEEASEILFGNEDELDARFVLLEDCGHSLEARGMDNWLSQSKGEVKMLRCPRCTQNIVSTQRYKNQVRQALIDIRAVKKKIFGELITNQIYRENIARKLHPLQMHASSGFRTMVTFTNEEEKLYKLLNNNLKVVQGKRKIYHSRSDLEILRVKTDILFDVHKTLIVSEGCNKQAKAALEERADRLLQSVRHRERLSAEEVQDLGLEVQRLHLIEMLFRIEAVVKGKEDKVQTTYAYAKSVLLSQQKLTQAKESKVREMLKEIASTQILLDRQMIVKAMHMGTGHWFKCPNGHIYAIGNCGGAVVESRCPECKASIDGSSHRLRSDNAVATEMDGARLSAYDLNVAAYARR